MTPYFTWRIVKEGVLELDFHDKKPVMRCRSCGSTRPGVRGLTETQYGVFHRFRHDCVLHPLPAIFMAAGFTLEAGMNWLQDRGLISDNCVEFWEVAPYDVFDIIERAGFSLNPAWLARVRETWEKKELGA